VSPGEYRNARVEFLAKEKELTHAYDALCKDRRALPVVEVGKDYTFTRSTADGKEETISLSDLFDGRRQLVVYHMMFDPSSEAACAHCCLIGDSVPSLEHLHARSTSFVVVSRAPLEKIMAFKKRMSWNFPWVSSNGSVFNYDFHVTQDEKVAPIEYNFKTKDELEKRGQDFFARGEQPGHSCFVRGGNGIGDEGKIYHTYSTYARGGELVANTYVWLDMTLLGRRDDEFGFGSRRKDEY
jgi:predicted dithiol-disulfide oxidoreductase (DUF899 family)